jgi:hypothetical protein
MIFSLLISTIIMRKLMDIRDFLNIKFHPKKKDTIIRWLKKFINKRDDVILNILQFYRNQQKINGLVKWNWHRCNFDQHLQTLRCQGLDLKSMKKEIARELCKVHNTQISSLI